jgi:AraC family transcriptional regulator
LPRQKTRPPHPCVRPPCTQDRTRAWAPRVSPKTAFRRLRIEKANELMSRSDFTLEDVARHCGYANPGHFCREYKRVHNFTPTHWRKRLVAGFAKPLPPGVVPVREFSARPTDRTMSA